MYLQAIVLLLMFADPNTVGYIYEWHETSIAPTPEVQSELTTQQWEDGYIPWWYPLEYPGVDPNMWFRWERKILPTAVEWLRTPRDLNGDGEANLPDYGIVAAYHPGGLKIKPKPPPPAPPPRMTKLEVMILFMELLEN